MDATSTPTSPHLPPQYGRNSPDSGYFNYAPVPGQSRGDSPHWPTTPLTPSALFPPATNHRLSVGSIRSKSAGQQMEKTAPVFDDPKMRYYQAYSELLDDLAEKDTSSNQFGPHIEDWLVKSEQDWFAGYHNASLGMSSTNSSTTSLLHGMKSEKSKTPRASAYVARVRDSRDAADFRGILGDDYEVPNGLKKFLLQKAGTWHYYTILLALVSPPYLAWTSS